MPLQIMQEDAGRMTGALFSYALPVRFLIAKNVMAEFRLIIKYPAPRYKHQEFQ